MGEPVPYDEDIYAWTQHQASVLRGLARVRRDLPNDLDLEHVAEEIEDAGKAELKTVRSHLRQLLLHALKLAASPDSDAAAGWRIEILDHQELAVDHVTNAMLKDIDLDGVWRRACRDAGRKLAVYGETLPEPPDRCPLTLDALLDEDFDIDSLLARIRDAVTG